MTPEPATHPLFAKLPLERYEADVAGRRWTLGIVRDEEVQLNFSEDRAIYPFGLMIWESALLLADVMGREARPGMSVIELGCGVGLPAIVAAARGADVVQSDHDPLALAVAADNARLNGVTGVRQMVGDWHKWDSDETYDLVIGADMIYDTADYETLVALFTKLMKPGGRVLLTDPNRLQTVALTTLLEDAGWQITITQHETADVTHGMAGSQVKVQLIELKQG